LDMRAKDVLLNALEKYTGTVVFVSHDRYFIDKLATRVFEVGGGTVEVFPGNYEDYLWRKEGKAQSTSEVAVSKKVGPGRDSSGETMLLTDALSPQNGNGSEHKASASRKRLNPLKRKEIEARCREVEEQIARFEAGIARCETSLQSFTSNDESLRLTQELTGYRAAVAKLMAEWEELAHTLHE
jgi:ATP-binding cassette, subfamily F, member 3